MSVTPEPERLQKYQLWFSTSRIAYLIVFLAGGLLPLAFSPVDFYFIAVLSPAIFSYLLLFASPRRAAWLGCWFGMGFFGVGVSWGFVAIYVFGFSSIFAAVVLTFIGVSLMAAYLALQGYLSVKFIQKFNIVNRFVTLVMVFPLFWLLLEWFRGWFLTGFPWLSLGYSQTGSALSGYAPVLGVYGISWLTALSSSLLLIVFINKKIKTIIFALLSLIVIWSAGHFLSEVNWTETSGKPLKVSLVQGNVEQINKWNPEHFNKRKQRYLSLTKKHWDSDLILWPENSMTVFHHQINRDFLIPLAKEAKENKADIILGLPVLDKVKNEYFSSLMAINNSDANHKQIQFYHKSHLVPFGEYLPLESFLRGLIAFFDLPMSGFTPGKYNQALFTVANQKIAPTICYEDAFGEELARFLPEATLIMNASNNAWYGDSFAPHQHLQISQMRALEMGRDVMRVTTNGVSALINHQGKVTSRSPQFKSYVVTGSVQPRKGMTPFVQWRNTLNLIFVIAGLLGSIILSRKYFPA